VKAAIRGVCLPHADSVMRIIRLKSEVVRPTEIVLPLRIGRASVYRVLGAWQAGSDRVAA